MDFDQVRIAQPHDEPEIIRLMHLLHEENGLLPLDESCLHEMCMRSFGRKGGIIGVIGPTGNIQGMIYLLISRFWYTRENHLEELFSYVLPEFRHGSFKRGVTHAEVLVNFAKKCSVEIGLPLVIGILTNNRMAGKVRLYRRELGYPSGAFFVFNAKWNSDVKPADEDFWKEPFRETRGGKKRGVGKNGKAQHAQG